jgi:hypothetical protein
VYQAKSHSLEYSFCSIFVSPQFTIRLSHQCEVLCDLYESFHAGTSNNIWVFLWRLFIYSGAKFLNLYILLSYQTSPKQITSRHLVVIYPNFYDFRCFLSLKKHVSSQERGKDHDGAHQITHPSIPLSLTPASKVMP